MILLIDNYDSFVHNLARYLRLLGQETQVIRNDAIDAAGVEAMQPAAIVLSPGPCGPQEAGCTVEVVRQLYTKLPILGICLGHQAIAAALGAKVIRAPRPIHGQATEVLHDGDGIFAGLPKPLSVGRYHSLLVDGKTLPPTLRQTAWTDDGLTMALAHSTLPIYGVQFHPESVLTESGLPLLSNFLRLAGVAIPTEATP